jgi:hypothetical protein
VGGADGCLGFIGFKVSQSARYFHDADANAWGKVMLLARFSQQFAVRCADTIERL